MYIHTERLIKRICEKKWTKDYTLYRIPLMTLDIADIQEKLKAIIKSDYYKYLEFEK